MMYQNKLRKLEIILETKNPFFGVDRSDTVHVMWPLKTLYSHVITYVDGCSVLKMADHMVK